LYDDPILGRLFLWYGRRRTKAGNMHRMLQSSLCLTFALAAALATSMGCRSFDTYSPTPLEDLPFRDRVQTKTEGDVRVSVAVLSEEEARALYDAKVYKKKMQPVWVQVENRRDEQIVFLPRSVDRDYVSPLEGAYRSKWTWNKKANTAMELHFYEQAMPFEVPAHSTRSGIVLGERRKGARFVMVDLVAENFLARFQFVAEVPGFPADYLKAIQNYGGLFESTEIVDLDEDELQQWIAELPCCTKNAKGTKTGDPLNIIVIGHDDAVWPAFLTADWDLTASMSTGTALKTGLFGIFGGAYRYAPISSLYVFDRPQDIALQKVRHNIHLRNHLRLWAAPVTFQGMHVWVGQISRDIGSRITTKSSTLTTHKIDPDVDETRTALIQDFLYTQTLAAFAYAKGVGEVTPIEPRGNLTGDPWFTDGLRAVMVLSAEPVTYQDIDNMNWEEPRPRWTAEEIVEAAEAKEKAEGSEK
jgi:hypothetical protein